MNELEEKEIQCPYCGETINVLIDPSVPDQDYIEDCRVCCRPIRFNVKIISSEDVSVFVSAENE
ncbi:MAG: CPXCG motif-containing cysteine-rich protein [Fibrobacterota bacterium]